MSAELAGDEQGAAAVYGLGLPVGVVVVNAAYCAGNGAAAFTGSCIAAAFAQANESPAGVGKIVLEPGLFRSFSLWRCCCCVVCGEGYDLLLWCFSCPGDMVPTPIWAPFSQLGVAPKPLLYVTIRRLQRVRARWGSHHALGPGRHLCRPVRVKVNSWCCCFLLLLISL